MFNRLDATGQPVRSVTAVLADFLNNPYDDSGYVRLAMTKLLSSISQSDTRLAVYSLGDSLHVLQDFTGDPQKLMDLAAHLQQPRGKQPRELASALGDYGDLLDLGREQVHGEMTVKALRLVVQHLSGVPGRKNLVWLMRAFYTPPPAVMALMQQAGVVLYPVLVRSVYGDTLILERERAAQALAAATGGRAFFDAMDFPSAVRAAEEDSSSAYVLGFYPYENQLDGKYHRIVVKLKNPKLANSCEIRYRLGYLATKVALPPPAPSPQELYEGPMDSTGIGISAQAAPDAAHPGLFDVAVTVDLRDVHLESKDGHFIGAIDLSIPDPSAQHTVKNATIPIDLTQDQLTTALASGLSGTVNAVAPQAGQIRVVVRDHSTGLAGSVRVPVAKSPPASK